MIIEESKELKKYYNSLKDGIIIYTMGKVGSKTVYNFLLKNQIPVYHIHWLNGFFPFKVENHKFCYSSKLYGILWNIQAFIRKILFNYMLNYSKSKLKIITLVREPIERNISHMFQDSIGLMGEAINNLNSFKEMSNKKFFQYIYDNYINKYYPINYFNNEIGKNLNISLEDVEFDCKKGYSIKNTDRFELLIIRLDQLNNLNDIISDFANFQNVKTLQTSYNRSSNKWYKSNYEDFINSIHVDHKYLNKILDSNYMKTFYTEEEINDYYKKWIKHT